MEWCGEEQCGVHGGEEWWSVIAFKDWCSDVRQMGG